MEIPTSGSEQEICRLSSHPIPSGTGHPISPPPANFDELEREAHRLGHLPLVQGLVRLLEEGRRGDFLDALRDIAFLAGDGALREDGVDLGTKSSDWPVHLSVFRTAQALGYVSEDAEPHLHFGFQLKKAGGIARAWELCTSGIGASKSLRLTKSETAFRIKAGCCSRVLLSRRIVFGLSNWTSPRLLILGRPLLVYEMRY